MRNRSSPKRGERGQVLIFVTILMMLAALIVPPVLSMTSAATRSTNVSKEKMQQYYAADTGIEDASYALTADPGFFAALRESQGGAGAPFYDLKDVNGYDVHVEIDPGASGDGLYQIVSTAATGFDEQGKPTGKPTVVRSEVAVYQLNVSSGDGGDVTAPGEGFFTYAPGNVVTLIAAADPGWGFVNWMGGPVVPPNSATATIAMNGDYTIRANFSGNFTLTVNCMEGGNVTADGGLTVVGPGQGSKVYEAGTAVNLQALEGQGYGFVNWTRDVGTVDDVGNATTHIHMYGNYTIQANFGLKWCTLTPGSTGGGNVTTPGEPGPYQYLKDSTVALVAEADECYRFVEWAGPDEDRVADRYAVSTTITMLGNYTIQANFEALPNYVLNVSHGVGGHVTAPGEGGFTYCEGTVVPLLAVPDLGYGFGNWTDDVATVANPNDASTTITMNGNYTIQANFLAIPYQLTVGHTGPGHVAAPPGEGTFSYPPGTVVSLSAVADEGNHFGNWTGDVGTVADIEQQATTITMNDDYAITANFHSGPPYYQGFDYALCSFGGLTVSNNSVITGDMYAGGAVVFGNNAKVKADPSKDIKGNAFGKGNLQFDNNGVVEGSVYSQQGDVKLNNNSQVYGDAYAGGDVVLSNNGKLWQSAYARDDISVGTNGIIYGDATYVDTITVGGGGQVKGQKIKDPDLVLPDFPVVTPPTLTEINLWMAHYEAEAEEGGIHDGAYTIQNNQTLTLGPIHIKGNLVITNNCTITLGGIVYVDGTITISNNCKIQGQGTLVAEGSITAQNSAMLDMDGIPVVMTLGSIEMKNNSTTQAVLFAPLGTVNLKNNASVFGAVVANGITSNNNFQVTYDPSLKDRDDLPGS